MSPANAILLLTVAMAVALLARRLRVPYTVALVGVGLALGEMRILPTPRLTKDLLYSAFLPGLLFEAAFHLDAREFWRNGRLIFALAVPGVVIGIGVTAPLIVVLPKTFELDPPFAWSAALVFSAFVAATDPIAVVALFRSVGAPRRLAVVVDGESLVNDGTAVVLSAIALDFVSGTTTSAWGASIEFLRVAGLGVLLGAAFGFAVSKIVARIDDPLVEITFTTIAAYGSFSLAERFQGSGVLATVAAGMLCGSYGAPHGMSARTRVAVESFWEYIAFALNSIVFLLIGLAVSLDQLLESWRPIVVAYVIVMATRAMVVFLALLFVSRTRERFEWKWGIVLTWGGLRGALSMVLALALADSFPGRLMVIRVTFGVVVLTILVNGLSIEALLRRLGMGASKNGGGG